jgi:drug/metabolite transporter (DMT)-like permease
MAVLNGDFAGWRPAEVPLRAWLGLAYLAAFGSVLGFTAYLYLLRRVAPAVVATYAFVNPIVALLLGFVFAGETLSPRTMLAVVVVLAAVILIVAAPARRAAGSTAGAGALPARRH